MNMEIVVPQVGESIREVTLGQWLKMDGEVVAADVPICVIESEKAAIEVPSPGRGRLRHRAREGETVGVGSVIAILETEAIPAEMGAERIPDSVPARGRLPHVTPLARQLMESSGLDASGVQGTGLGGRILRGDVEAALASSRQKGGRGEPVAGPVPSGGQERRSGETPSMRDDAPSPSGGVRRERVSTLRRALSRRLVAARNEAAMLTTFNEVDLSRVLQIRRDKGEDFRRRWGVKLGFMSFFTRAVCLALKQYPSLNACLEGEDILFHDFCDLSIAVSTDRGLVVPVVRRADRMDLGELEQEIARLAEKAREGKLSLDEMSGGTFTLTNGGVFGSLLSTPLLNSPQSGILGMHTIQDRPVVRDGEIVIRPMMYLALSYDHRLIDGRESVGFVMAVKEILESGGTDWPGV